MEAMTLDGQGLLSQTSIIISKLSFLVEGVFLLTWAAKVSCGPSRMEYNGVSRFALLEGEPLLKSWSSPFLLVLYFLLRATTAVFACGRLQWGMCGALLGISA